MKKKVKGIVFILLIAALYMVLEYKTRGYFAWGAEILFVPAAIIMLLTKEEKKEEQE